VVHNGLVSHILGSEFYFLETYYNKTVFSAPLVYPNHPTIASMQCFYGLLDFATIGDTSSIPTYSALRSNATRHLCVYLYPPLDPSAELSLALSPSSDWEKILLSQLLSQLASILSSAFTALREIVSLRPSLQ
jgi:hypothetical protein